MDDELNACVLSEGYLPSMERLKQARPKYPRGHYDAAFEALRSREEAAVWLYATLARRIVQKRADSRGLEIEAWLLGHPAAANARLAQWFEGQGVDYRLIVLRRSQPRASKSPGYVFGDLDNRLGVRHRSGQYGHLLPVASGFLHEMLDACRDGPVKAERVVAATGHAYWRSTGFPV
ncbi:MAG: hypothetical protein SF069_11770 [Phycisphaerae bacterium]|nr:hypothetical protein [Phycisphaerae bacterium]